MSPRAPTVPAATKMGMAADTSATLIGLRIIRRMGPAGVTGLVRALGLSFPMECTGAASEPAYLLHLLRTPGAPTGDIDKNDEASRREEIQKPRCAGVVNPEASRANAGHIALRQAFAPRRFSGTSRSSRPSGRDPSPSSDSRHRRHPEDDSGPRSAAGEEGVGKDPPSSSSHSAPARPSGSNAQSSLRLGTPLQVVQTDVRRSTRLDQNLGPLLQESHA
jgi:hypothetical protein